MFGGLGMGEMVLIFLVVLLLFGAKRLPEIGSSLGKGIREFKSSVREIETELKMPEDRPKVKRAPERQQETKSETPQQDEESGGGEPRRLTTSQ